MEANLSKRSNHAASRGFKMAHVKQYGRNLFLYGRLIGTVTGTPKKYWFEIPAFDVQVGIFPYYREAMFEMKVYLAEEGRCPICGEKGYFETYEECGRYPDGTVIDWEPCETVCPCRLDADPFEILVATHGFPGPAAPQQPWNDEELPF